MSQNPNFETRRTSVGRPIKGCVHCLSGPVLVSHPCIFYWLLIGGTDCLSGGLVLLLYKHLACMKSHTHWQPIFSLPHALLLLLACVALKDLEIHSYITWLHYIATLHSYIT
jgi:hypothetical protein